MNTNKKLRFMIIVMTGFFIGQESLCAFSFGNFFKRYEKKKPADIIKDLEDQLIDDPKNPQINYNLGVAQYQLNHFNDAKHNFERAALYGDKAVFKEQAYFNFATCLLKNTLSMLPQNWKNPDQEIDPNLLETAINEISNAIKQYESVLLINEKNEKAISNKKESEKILRKLLEKKKQQEEKDQNQKDNKDDQDQKQDQQEQDKNKQNKDNQKNNKNDQQTKDQDQNSQDNKDSSGQDQKSQKQDKQEQQEQGKKDSNNSSKNDDAQSQNNGKKDEPEQRGEKESANDQDENKEPGSERPEKKDGADQEKKNVDHNEHDKKDNEQAKSTPAQPTQAEDEKQENENTQSGNTGFGDQEDSTEKRAYRAILDNLDTDESKLQKHLIMQKAKGQKPPVGSMQKPW